MFFFFLNLYIKGICHLHYLYYQDIYIYNNNKISNFCNIMEINNFSPI